MGRTFLARQQLRLGVRTAVAVALGTKGIKHPKVVNAIKLAGGEESEIFDQDALDALDGMK